MKLSTTPTYDTLIEEYRVMHDFDVEQALSRKLWNYKDASEKWEATKTLREGAAKARKVKS